MRQITHGLFAVTRRRIIRDEHSVTIASVMDNPCPGMLSMDETPGEPTIFAVVDYDPGDEDHRWTR